MKKLILLATGGTIASVAGENGLTPGISGAKLLEKVNLSGVEITCRDVFALDSSNVQPEEWRVLAAAAFHAAQEADGVVITHGTDTMAYSAAALSFMLHGLRAPVVFTGSQLPMGHLLSDAPMNLAEAVETARTAPPGVYITFNHKIIRGCRAVKMRTTSFDAFDSINEAPAGYLDSEGAHYRTVPMREPRGQPELLDQLEPRVFLLKLMPGTTPEVFDWIASSGIRGVVLEAFGLGGLHYIRRNLVDKLRMLGDKGIITLVTTQCLYEKTNFDLYQVGRNVLSGNVFSGKDMTGEAAVAKLMWVLGDPEKRMRLLGENVCGEISL